MTNKSTIYGVEPIYTDIKADSVANIIKILEESLPIHNRNKKYQEENLSFHNGITQINDIPNTDRKFDIKIVSNKIKPIIENVVSMALSEPFYYSLFESDNDLQKKDLETITKYLKVANEHKKDCDTFQKLLIEGTAYRYTSSIYSDYKPSRHLPFNIDLIDDCIYVRSYEVGNPVEVSFIISEIDNSVTRIVAFTNQKKYIFETNVSVTRKFKLVTESNHNLGTNPIQEYRNGLWGISLVSDLKGNQTLINILKSSMVNDTLTFVNKMLLLFGVEINEEVLKSLRSDNVLAFPGAKDINYDGKYIESQLDNQGNKDQIEMAQEDMLFIASVPSQNVGRAETGEAAKTANGSTLADLQGDRRMQGFIEPKREQLQCIISILRTNGYLKSDIQVTDIDIKFDNNRLISSIEMIRVVIELIKSGADIYEVCKMFNIAADNKQFAELWEQGIKKIKEHEIEVKESGRATRTAPLIGDKIIETQGEVENE